MIIGVNYEEFAGQDTYESVYLSYMEEGERKEIVFDSGDFVQDYSAALTFFNEEGPKLDDILLLGSSSIDDFLDEAPQKYQISGVNA